MKLVLARIDDRLIHGQVTVGWGRKLRPQNIVLASDEVAADAWQSRVYAMTVPPEVKVMVLAVDEAATVLQRPADHGLAGRRVLVLTGTAGDMTRLVESGAPVTAVNVGGMHFARGKRELLPDVYMDRDDLEALRTLGARGVAVSVQSVPGTPAEDLDPGTLRDLEGSL